MKCPIVTDKINKTFKGLGLVGFFNDISLNEIGFFLLTKASFI